MFENTLRYQDHSLFIFYRKYINISNTIGILRYYNGSYDDQDHTEIDP